MELTFQWMKTEKNKYVHWTEMVSAVQKNHIGNKGREAGKMG